MNQPLDPRVNRRRRSPRRPPAWLVASACILSFCGSLTTLDAQWVEREVPLDEGWNAIWIDAEPTNGDVDELLAELDWDSIWAPAADSTAAPQGTRWISAHRDAPSFLQSLEAVSANHAYLLRLRTAGTLRFVGRAQRRVVPLRRDRHVLAGIPLDARNRPSFDEALSNPGVRDNVESVHGIVDGEVRALSLGDRTEANRAYWIYARKGVPDIAAIRPLLGPNGVDFGERGVELTVELAVTERPFPQFVLVRGLASATPPDGAAPDASEGSVRWLELRDPDDGFVPITEPVSVEVPANTSRVAVQLRARRGLGALETGGGGGVGGSAPPENQALLEITDTDGNRAELGVVAGFPSLEGVWAGRVRLDEIATHPDHGEPVFAPSPAFDAALIVEFDESGNARLLDSAEVPIDRDGRSARLRLDALLFPDPVDLDGAVTGGGTAGRVEGATTTAADHPLNPFRHRYHPEHRDGIEIARAVALTFASSTGDGGEAEETRESGALAGTYEETIAGLLPSAISVRGTFRLRRVDDLREEQP